MTAAVARDLADELDPLELRRRIRMASERVSQLRAEEQTLHRVCDQLRAEVVDLERSLTAARDGRDRLEKRLVAQRERSLAVQVEIESTRSEIAAINERLLTDAARAEELAGRSAAAEETLAALTGELSAAGCTLSLVEDTVNRMRQRVQRRGALDKPGKGA